MGQEAFITWSKAKICSKILCLTELTEPGSYVPVVLTITITL